MSRSIMFGASLAIALVSLSGLAEAKQCRDANGKFIACATAAAAPGARCKDATGKFAKCGAPGATPMIASVTPPVKPTVTPAVVKSPSKPTVTPALVSAKTTTSTKAATKPK